MSQSEQQRVKFEGICCSIEIQRPVRGLVVLVIAGRDAGELGDAPFRELECDLERGTIELFIDARATLGASVAVSHEWSQWLQQQRARLASIHMLTGSKFIQLTADFVRRFAQLGEQMRIYSDPVPFEEALASSAQRLAAQPL